MRDETMHERVEAQMLRDGYSERAAVAAASLLDDKWRTPPQERWEWQRLRKRGLRIIEAESSS